MTPNTLYTIAVSKKTSMLGAVLLCAAVLGISFLWGQRAAAAPSVAPVTIVAAGGGCNKGGFFGLEPWYHFMPDSEIGVQAIGDIPADSCGIQCFNILIRDSSNPNECGETASDIPGVILAVIDDLLKIGGLVAVAFIIIGSFQFVASRGNAEKTAQAQSTVISALTGLAIVLVAVAFVSFIGSRLA